MNKAKKLRPSNEDIQELFDKIKSSFETRKQFKLSDFQEGFDAIETEPAEVFISQTASMKMWSLVDEFSTEVQWHGTAYRVGEKQFLIDDIVIQPQKVTSTTADTDDEEYAEWLDTLDDETFNNMRFHGHSHVLMGVSPSSVDMKYRSDLVSTMDSGDADNNFYIFIILNKRREWSCEVYDIAKNILYSTATKTVNLSYQYEGEFASFIEEAREKVKEQKPATISFSWSNYKEKARSSSIDDLYNKYKDYDYLPFDY